MANRKPAEGATPRWESRVALAISLLALVASAIGIKIAHSDRAHDTTSALRGEVRNVSRNETSFGRLSQAGVGQLLEFRGHLLNTGNVPANDVALNVTLPGGGNGQVVPGSCRIERPGVTVARCSDTLDERHLRIPRLGPDESVDVRFLLRTQPPPCDGYRAETTFAAWSEDRAAINDRVDGMITGGTGIACGTDEAKLMALIPASHRGRCRLGASNDNVDGAKAHIQCPDPAKGISEVQYFTFGTQQEADDHFDKRLKAVDKSYWRRCSVDPDGEGAINYRGRSEPELRYFCWYDDSGDLPGSWVELVNERYHLYLFAYRADNRWTDLFNWANHNTP